MSFSQVIGHKKAKAYFASVIQSQEIPHAFLFEGMAGIGKAKLAFEIARGIFCDQDSQDPCGSCKSCLKMLHDNHPDFMVVKPDGKQIKNHQIEEFQSFLSKKAYEGSYKVVCIEDADKMNASAQNRILKTLEEPSDKVIIFLISHKPLVLMETVRSRCQSVKLNGLSQESIEAYLKNDHNLDSQKCETISRLCNGSLGKAIYYADSQVFEEVQEQVLNLLKAIDQKNKGQVLKTLSFFSSEKENISDIFEYMVLWYRDLLLYKKAKAKSLVMHTSELDLIKKLSRHLTVGQIIKNIETINWTERKLNQNGNFDLSIELMLIQLLEA